MPVGFYVKEEGGGEKELYCNVGSWRRGGGEADPSLQSDIDLPLFHSNSVSEKGRRIRNLSPPCRSQLTYARVKTYVQQKMGGRKFTFYLSIGDFLGGGRISEFFCDSNDFNSQTGGYGTRPPPKKKPLSMYATTVGFPFFFSCLPIAIRKGGIGGDTD